MSISRSYRAIVVVIVGAVFLLGGCFIRAASPPRSSVESSRTSSTIWTRSSSGGTSLPLSGSVGTWSSGHWLGIKSWLDSVLCPTATFCVAVDGNGYEYTFSGGKWTSGLQVNTHSTDFGSFVITSVACSTTKFCVPVAVSGYEFTYSW